MMVILRKELLSLVTVRIVYDKLHSVHFAYLTLEQVLGLKKGGPDPAMY